MNVSEYRLLLRTLQFQLALPSDNSDSALQTCPLLTYNAAVAGHGKDAMTLKIGNKTFGSNDQKWVVESQEKLKDASFMKDVRFPIFLGSLDGVEEVVTDDLTAFETKFCHQVFDALHAMNITHKKERFFIILKMTSLLNADFRPRLEDAKIKKWTALWSQSNSRK
ncbi:hypothetical protein DFS34DRAFT_590938 [Phlyctochytrium arcticum]|nr:hypothetical protein DFS34DRAFT_590938 [Phlyctochytrium arcticum]